VSESTLLRLSNKSRHGPTVTVTMMTMKWKGIMRITFNIEMTVDVVLNDDKRKQAFRNLVSQQARGLYGVSSVLTKKRAPEMKVTMIDENGKTNINILGDK